MKDGRKLILIADDEREIRDVVSLLMRGEGYEVILAEDGEDVLGKMSPEVDLYILDLRTRKRKRLTRGKSVEASPCWNPPWKRKVSPWILIG